MNSKKATAENIRQSAAAEAKHQAQPSDEEVSGIKHIREFEPKEQLRRMNAEHALKIHDRLQDQLCVILKQRAIEGDETAEKRLKALEILYAGAITSSKRVGEATANTVEQCVVESPKGKLVAFLKRQSGQEEIRVVNGDVFSVIRKPMPDGTLREELRPVKSDQRQTFLMLADLRMKSLPGIIRRISETYDISSQSLPFKQGEQNMKLMDSLHTIKSEIACSALDTIIGDQEIPPTVLKVENHDIASLQQGISGQPMDPEQYLALCETQETDLDTPSLARLGTKDYRNKSSDRHPNNVRYDQETHTFYGIDNGYALGFSENNPDAIKTTPRGLRRQPVDKYFSLPLEIMERNENIRLSQADRQKLKQVWNDVKNHLAYKQGRLSEDEASKLPEAVKNGVIAKAISDVFRFVFERVDENGDMIPETAKIAKQEARDYLAKLYELSQTGRPPKLGKLLHRMEPTIRKMMEMQQAAARKK